MAGDVATKADRARLLIGSLVTEFVASHRNRMLKNDFKEAFAHFA